MKLRVALFLLISLILASFTGDKPKSSKRVPELSNPFYAVSTLPYQAPLFDKIKDADFQPALEQGRKEQLAEMLKIANNAAAPTFKNTIIEMEKSGRLLDRVNNVFNLLTGANTNPQLQKVQEEEAPKQAAHLDAIHLNSKLFKRVETLYNNRNHLTLDAESNRLLEYTFQQFVVAGARLSDANKTTLKKLNEQEASLSAKFTNQLLAGTKNSALVVDDTTALAGLSGEEKSALAQNAKANNLTGKWMISLQNTTQQPLLQSLSNRSLREKLFEASWNRTEKNDSNDTRTIIVQIAKIRAEKSKLMGFPNYAALVLQDQMAKTPATVDQFLEKLVHTATAKAAKEASDIQALIDKQGGAFKVQPWDWNYYSEQVRKAKYDLNDDEIKPYFELNNVLEKGVFYAANQLYGITFKERHDIPVYQSEVRVFELFDKDGSTIGLFYGDYFKRDNKSGGAWMNNLVGQSKLLGTKPVIYNVCNFTKPASGEPALISYDDVTTMFHEFGHALHGFFASQQYPTLSGANTARDFVEFPSQFNEHWALYPSILKNYAINFKTHEIIPQALVDKIKNASTFNQGYKLTELLAAASLDMQWHKLSATDAIQDADKFETGALQKAHLNMVEVPTRYRSSYFLHIWANGYAAGYYAYLWTEMLDDDAFAWFEEHGGLTRANGQRFRDMILSRGNTIEYGKMFRDFRGHDPEIGPMEKSRGLTSK